MRFLHWSMKGNNRSRSADKEGLTLERGHTFFDLIHENDLAALLEEELPYGGVFGQADRPVVRVCGVLRPS